MSSISDKCYHVVCAIPVVQTVVGGALALKDIIGIIKDIAMTCLFTNFSNNIEQNMSNLQETAKVLEAMEVQRDLLTKAAIYGNDQAKKTAVEGMKKLQDQLRDRDMLFVLDDHVKKSWPSNTDYMHVSQKTNVYIHQAVIHCGDQKKGLSISYYFAQVVPVKTRLYNLATNIISMIPTYNIGTVYNLATLGYHCFIKS